MVFKITEEGSSHGEDFVSFEFEHWNLNLIDFLFCAQVYLFKAHVPMFAPVKIESKEFEMIKKMVSIVTSFIINGNPNTSDITFDQTTSKNPFNCLNISNDLIEMFELPEKERMKFWDGILKDANIPLYWDENGLN